jgi:hypothetical protein
VVEKEQEYTWKKYYGVHNVTLGGSVKKLVVANPLYVQIVLNLTSRNELSEFTRE